MIRASPASTIYLPCQEKPRALDAVRSDWSGWSMSSRAGSRISCTSAWIARISGGSSKRASTFRRLGRVRIALDRGCEPASRERRARRGSRYGPTARRKPSGSNSERRACRVGASLRPPFRLRPCMTARATDPPEMALAAPSERRHADVSCDPTAWACFGRRLSANGDRGDAVVRIDHHGRQFTRLFLVRRCGRRSAANSIASAASESVQLVRSRN